MAEGYTGKKVDMAWWFDQIHDGEQWRSKKAYQPRWKDWRKYYRGEWKKGVQPSNIYFKMLRTTVPRIYFRDPTVSITSSVAGFEAMVFARILERIDNKLIKQMKLKRQMKKIVHDTFMFGSGFGKLGYGAEFTPADIAAIGEAPSGSINKPNRVEYNSTVSTKQPWFMRVSPGNIILPNGLSDFEDTRWIAHHIIRTRQDVLDDERMEVSKRSKTTSTRSFLMTAINIVSGVSKPLDMVNLFEIRDKKTGKVFVISPDFDEDVLFESEDDLQIHGGIPFYHVSYNPDDECVWGVPDSQILDPEQRELNETQTQIMMHRRLSLRKILAKKNVIDEVEKSKINSEEISAIIEIDGDPLSDIKELQGNTIPDDLFKASEFTRKEARESLGFSRNQFGEFKPGSGDTTATEASIVNQSSEIRVDERRDSMADMLTDIVQDMHHIIFEKWGQDQVIDIMGPGGYPVWVSFTGEMLKQGQYVVKVDPDTAINESRETRQNRAVQVYGLLRDDPMIDPFKLRQYLLNELHGTAFDDMILLPTQPGGSPENPLDTRQAAQLFQGGASNAAV